MYFGSVRFFKHLIVAVVLILIIGLSISTVTLSFSNSHYKDRLSAYEGETILAKSNSKLQELQESIAIDYQSLYPELYADLSKIYKNETNTVYLTFDDGPSQRTIEILDILKEKNVKATFFVIGKDGEMERAIMKRIVEDGHKIAIHTYSHVYNDIYSSVENYLADFDRIYNLVYDATGVKTDIFRFPGGSINKYNAIYNEEICAEMNRRGFTYYDWNASSGDADQRASAYSVYTNSVASSQGKERVILLMHDSSVKTFTVAALPGIIDYYKAMGYEFDKIENDVAPIAFNYRSN